MSNNKFRLHKIRINKSGYDDCGYYFGIGLPVWFYCSEDESVSDFFRAQDREHAKELVLHWHENAKFYR